MNVMKMELLKELKPIFNLFAVKGSILWRHLIELNLIGLIPAPCSQKIHKKFWKNSFSLNPLFIIPCYNIYVNEREVHITL